MELSRLVLNPRSRDVQRDLSDCQGLHRRILSAFPAAPAGGVKAREHFGVLYRVDVQPRMGTPVLLVQSSSTPDWNALPATYMLPATAAPNPATKSVAAAYAALTPGASLRFRLRANPTKRVSPRGEGERNLNKWAGKRIDLRTEEEQIAWLRRKGAQGGFQLEAVQTSADIADVRWMPEGRLTGRRQDNDGDRRTLTFRSVLFEGRLVVTDAEQFRQTLAAGIGSGKAYGFGLLSVAPGGG
ncbi:MAG: type I-E CRISPR-associated protein Cas6/Cse3/CasE [Dehalococcoidia bacterium]